MVRLYSLPRCNNCEMFKEKLRKEKIEFEEIQEQEKLEEAAKKAGTNVAPVIEVDGMFFDGIGGLRNLGLV